MLGGFLLLYFLFSGVLVDSNASSSQATCALIAKAKNAAIAATNSPVGYLDQTDFKGLVSSFTDNGFNLIESQAMARYLVERNIFNHDLYATILHRSLSETMQVKGPAELERVLLALEGENPTGTVAVQQFIQSVIEQLRKKIPRPNAGNLLELEKLREQMGISKAQFQRLMELLYNTQKQEELEQFVLGTILYKDPELMEKVSKKWSWGQLALTRLSSLWSAPKAETLALAPDVAKVGLKDRLSVRFKYGTGQAAWDYLIKNHPEWIKEMVMKGNLDPNASFGGKQGVEAISPLFYAVKISDAELFDSLIAKGADPVVSLVRSTYNDSSPSDPLVAIWRAIKKGGEDSIVQRLAKVLPNGFDYRFNRIESTEILAELFKSNLPEHNETLKALLNSGRLYLYPEDLVSLMESQLLKGNKDYFLTLLQELKKIDSPSYFNNSAYQSRHGLEDRITQMLWSSLEQKDPSLYGPLLDFMDGPNTTKILDTLRYSTVVDYKMVWAKVLSANDPEVLKVFLDKEVLLPQVIHPYSSNPFNPLIYAREQGLSPEILAILEQAFAK